MPSGYCHQGPAHWTCQVRPPFVVATMRSWYRGLPEAGKTLARPVTQPTSGDMKLAACGFVIAPMFPFVVSVAPSLVATSQGAVPGPHAEQ